MVHVAGGRDGAPAYNKRVRIELSIKTPHTFPTLSARSPNCLLQQSLSTVLPPILPCSTAIAG